jgi:organic hydroperoxide reductase OsmC/OhrA
LTAAPGATARARQPVHPRDPRHREGQRRVREEKRNIANRRRSLRSGVAQALVDAAHETCPYSKATRGNIDVVINLV